MNLRFFGSAFRRVALLGLVVPPTALLPSLSCAQTWTGSTDAIWQTSGNWNASIPGSTETATFNSTSTLNLGITLSTAATVRGLLVTDPAGPITLSGSAITLGTSGIDMAAATQNIIFTNGVTIANGKQVWNVAPGRSITTGTLPNKPGQPSNNAGVVQLGTTGTIRLGGATTNLIIDNQSNPWATYGPNDWAGLNAGVVVSSTYIAATTALTAGVINDIQADFTSAATVDVAAVRFADPVARTIGISNSATARTLTARGILVAETSGGGTITGNAGSAFIRPSRSAVANTAFNVIQNSPADFTINVNITNASSGAPVQLVKSGTGRLLLTNASNGYTGGTTINEGTIQIGNGAASGQLGSGNVANSGVLAFNRADAVTLTNTVTGVGRVDQVGGGLLTMSSTANQYAGGTVMTSGTVSYATSLADFGTGGFAFDGGGFQWKAGDSSDISVRPVSIGAGGARLNPNGNSVTLANAIGGGDSGGVTLVGSGTLNITAANTFSGPSDINAGVLKVNNRNGSALGSGAVNINSTATLSGTGALSGLVTVASGAMLAPGNGVGTLALGSLSLSDGSALVWDFSSTPANDLVVVSTTDGLTINGGTLSLYSENTTSTFGEVGTYNLFQYSGSVLGAGVNSLVVANQVAGKSYAFGEQGGYITLTIATSGLVAQWNVDASGNWGDPSNWTPSEPHGPGDTASFGQVITGPRTVTLGTDKTVGNVVFSNTNSYFVIAETTQALTIGDGGSTKSIQVTSGSHSIASGLVLASNVSADVASGQSLRLSGVVSGGGSLTKASGGTLFLTGSNTYTGDSTINAGVVEFAPGAIGSASLTLSGGELRYAAGNTEDISTKSVTFASGGGTIDTNGNDVSFANPLGGSGAGGLTKSGAGTLTLAAANTYFGPTQINAGVVSIAADAALGSDPSASLMLNGGALRSTAGFDSARSISVSAASVIEVSGESDRLTLTGVASGAGLLTKSGSGSLQLDGANIAFTGGMTLAGGTVTLAGGQANGFQGIGTGPITLQNGSVLNLNGVNGSFNATSWGTLTGGLVVAAGQSGSMNLPGRCTIASNLTGSGTLGVNVQFVRGELSGNWSAFTGQINVGTVAGQTAGDFRLNTTAGFGTAAVNLAAGVTMYPVINYSASPTTFTIGELSGDATATLTGQGAVNSGRIALYSVGGRNTDAMFAGTIRDASVSSAVQPVAITKVGAGVWTLSGTSTYTGATTVNGGTLYVATDAVANPTGALIGTGGITVNQGATLRSSTNSLFGSVAGQAKSITVNIGGKLIADDGADVMVGVVTLAGGTLASSGSSVSYGSWVFDGASALLAATENSTVSAVNIRMQNGASIDVAAGKRLTVAGSITDALMSGVSSVVKTGSGTLALTGGSVYTGATTISAGTLLANTALTTTAIGVAAAASLGGSGTVGAVTMSAGSLLAPGDGLGRLTVAESLTLTGSSGYLWQLADASGTAGATSGWDLLAVTGTLDIAATSADPFEIDLWTLSSGSPVTSGSAANFSVTQSYTWKIATAAGGISGFAADKFVINTSATNGTGGFANDFSGGTFSLAQSGNDLNLVFTGAAPSVITIDVPTGTQTQTEAGYPLLSGAVPMLKIGAGTLVVDQANTLTGSTTVQAGVLRIANASAIASSTLAVVAGGTAEVAASLRTSVAGLDLAGNGLVNVSSGSMGVASGLSATELVAEILEGRGDGSWTGTSGITSSVAAADVALGIPRGVGWLDNGDGSVSFAFAAPGDTNLDWQVDVLDAANVITAGKFNTGSPATWAQGDFNYDGIFNVLDAADFITTGLYSQGSYNSAPGAVGAVAAVPEPGMVAVSVVCLLCGVATRRLRRRRG